MKEQEAPELIKRSLAKSGPYINEVVLVNAEAWKKPEVSVMFPGMEYTLKNGVVDLESVVCPPHIHFRAGSDFDRVV